MLWKSLQASYAVLFLCTFEVFPPLNDIFQLAEFPISEEPEWKGDDIARGLVMSSLINLVRNTGFPIFMFGLMVADTALAFLSEKMIVKAFEKKS